VLPVEDGLTVKGLQKGFLRVLILANSRAVIHIVRLLAQFVVYWWQHSDMKEGVPNPRLKYIKLLLTLSTV
jgi:hypothetical protein